MKIPEITIPVKINLDVTPPGREAQVRALKNAKGVDNPYAVAWASYNKSDGPMWQGAKCDACGQIVPIVDGMKATHSLPMHVDHEDASIMGLCDGSGGIYADMIEHRGGKWVLLAKSTGKVLGSFTSREQAEQQEEAIQAHKHSDDAGRVRRYDFAAAGTLKPPQRMDNGFMRVEGRIARVGVQEYRDSIGNIRRELRLPEDVFNEDSLASFASLPVTNTHPPELLTAANARKYAVGSTGENIRRDGDYVAAPMLIFDGEAISAAEAGRSQLSNGYTCRLDPPNAALVEKWGKHDGIQREIRGNHVALVDHARAGAGAALRLDAGDMVSGEFGNAPEPLLGSPQNVHPKEPRAMAHKIKVDGLEIEVSGANDGAIIDRALANARRDGEEKAATEKKRADDAIAAKAESDKKLGELQTKWDAQAEKLRVDSERMVKCDECGGAGKVDEKPCAGCEGKGEFAAKNDTAERRAGVMQRCIERGAKSRAQLVVSAQKVLGANEKLDGKTDIEIRRAVVAKALPNFKLDGRSDAEVVVAFDIAIGGAPAAKKAPIDNVREGMGGNPPPRQDDAPPSDPDEAYRRQNAKILDMNRKRGGAQ